MSSATPSHFVTLIERSYKAQSSLSVMGFGYLHRNCLEVIFARALQCNCSSPDDVDAGERNKGTKAVSASGDCNLQTPNWTREIVFQKPSSQWQVSGQGLLAIHKGKMTLLCAFLSPSFIVYHSIQLAICL